MKEDRVLELGIKKTFYSAFDKLVQAGGSVYLY